MHAYRKANLPTRVAEAYWHAARLYDQLGDHKRSEGNFQLASENYNLAAEKIPRLKEFYADHTSYMLAWSEIEKARHNHAIRQYGQAKEHYEKAADLHKSTERWNHLSSDYLAWAKLEEAEDLSRKEQPEEAKNLFHKAADLFVEAKQSINAKLEGIDAIDEKELATELVEASDTRRELFWKKLKPLIDKATMPPAPACMHVVAPEYTSQRSRNRNRVENRKMHVRIEDCSKCARASPF